MNETASHDELLAAGWMRTASGRYSHPVHTPAQSGRRQLVPYADAVAMMREHEEQQKRIVAREGSDHRYEGAGREATAVLARRLALMAALGSISSRRASEGRA